MAKKILDAGKRYAIISKKSGRIRSALVTPQTEDNGEKHTVEIPDDHVAIELSGSSTGMINRPVSDFPAVDALYQEAISAKTAPAKTADKDDAK